MTFSVDCCKRPRGVIYIGKEAYPILVCLRCDYNHDAATVIPNEHLIKDQDPKP